MLPESYTLTSNTPLGEKEVNERTNSQDGLLGVANAILECVHMNNDCNAESIVFDVSSQSFNQVQQTSKYWVLFLSNKT